MEGWGWLDVVGRLQWARRLPSPACRTTAPDWHLSLSLWWGCPTPGADAHSALLVAKHSGRSLVRFQGRRIHLHLLTRGKE